MPQYDIEFARRLADVAASLVDDGTESLDGQRTVLYLSLLSTEIALKAMLETAGVPVAEIRKRSHSLSGLLLDLGRCDIQVNVGGNWTRASASSLRSCTIRQGGAQVVVGQVIDAEQDGASQYPNSVRYGDRLRHYPPGVVAEMAKIVVEFAHRHWLELRVR